MRRANICVADPMQQRVVTAIRSACRYQNVGNGLDIHEVAEILNLDYSLEVEASKTRSTVRSIKKQFLGRNIYVHQELFGNVNGKYVIARLGTELYYALVRREIVYSLKMAQGYQKMAENFAEKVR